jgi:DNA topoisomerase-1
MSDLDISLASAEAAGLRYVSDESPGIRRLRRGKGFSYVRPDGTTITDTAERSRIASLAIPPAWTDVWICTKPDGHVLATGRDAKGRKQYRYHPEWERVRSEDKFASLPSFAECLPDLRGTVDADMRRRGLPREKVLAVVVRLLDRTLIRVGNQAYALENESYGLTTMRPDHVEVEGSKIRFDFTAKGGLDRAMWMDDPRLARLVHQISELGGQELFAYEEAGGVCDVTSSDVNEYLRRHAGEGVTAKHFRTWGGTVSAAAALAVSNVPESERDIEKVVVAAMDVAAEVLGNTRTVCRASYVHPVIPESFRTGALAETYRRSRSTTHLDRIERTVQRLVT